ncbi:MAG: hypothetical protein ACLQQB_04705 [Solirubrobacteraceae bacterium]
MTTLRQDRDDSFNPAAIYEDRLESHAGCANQRIDAPGELTGTGVRYVPVEHEGNTAPPRRRPRRSLDWSKIC